MKKNRLILLVILLMLVGIYVFLSLKKPQEKDADLIKLNPDRIDMIEIWDAYDSVKLVKSDKGWEVHGALVWDADSLMVNSFFADVIAAKYPISPVSSSPEGLKRYSLEDSEALHIRVSAGKQSTHLLFSNLGKAWDYFRFADQNEIYQVKSKVSSIYFPEMARWRDPIILRIMEEELVSIEVKYLLNSYILTQDSSGWKFKDSRQEFNVLFNNYALTKIISILQNFSSYILDTDQNEEIIKKFDEPIATVWIKTTDKKTTKISFARFDENTSMMVKDDDFSIIHHVSHDTINRFTRAPQAFKEAPIF